VIVDHFGYSAAFIESAVAAGIAFAALAIAMPETAQRGGLGTGRQAALSWRHGLG
jgi:hypothetical protein